MRVPATTITYLAMDVRPDFAEHEFETLIACPMPMGYFRAMYLEVGRKYYWHEHLDETEEELQQYCNDRNKRIYTLIQNGAPAGFVVLHDQSPAVDIAYFGLLPEAVGGGLGGKWLEYAISEAWKTQGCKKVTVNTCTLDHPRALPLYLSKGFEIVNTENCPAIY